MKLSSVIPNINVTPLIDVLLVLLIIFMVVTPLKPSRFAAKVPEEPQNIEGLTPNPLTLVVSVKEDLSLKLNEEEVGVVEAPERLSARLLEVFRERDKLHTAERTVFIRAPRSMKYGAVVKVIDVVKGAGAEPVGLQVDDLP